MRLRKICLLFFSLSLLISASIVSLSLLNGCSTSRLPDYETVAVNVMPLDQNEPAPFAGVLILYERYDYLLRCENYVEQQGIIP